MRHAWVALPVGVLLACGSGSKPSTPPPGGQVFTLHLAVQGSGAITVGGGTTGRCDATCDLQVPGGTAVTLQAQAAEGQVLAGWDGACSGTGPCAFTVSGDTSVTARFEAAPPPPPGQRALTVVTTGAGVGRVVSDPAGIDCGSACRATFDEKTTVTLTAEPSGGSTFQGWSGACSGTGACQVTLDADVVVAAQFDAAPPPPPPATRTLTIDKTGAGAGTVTSAPSGIDCGPSCSAPFADGTQVTLTAAPAAGSTFQGWGGGACSGTGTCTLTLHADTTVTATFDVTPPPPPPAMRTLAIDKAGSGSGTVTSTPAGLDCGATCSATFAEGTQVTLTAAAADGSTFQGWGGGCSGTGSCVVTLGADTTVTATFALVPPPPPPAQHTLVVQKSGAGAGTVTSAPAGLDCGATCSASFAEGTQVTLTAAAAADSTFQGWSGGGCSGTATTCAVTIGTADVTVSATFAVVPPPPPPPPPPAQHNLMIAKAGNGTGTVTSTPTGLDCVASCSTPFAQGTQVTLTAAAAAGSTFQGWSGGGCSGTATTCAVTLGTADVTVTATFAVVPPPPPPPPAQHKLTIAKAGTGTGTVTSAPTGLDCGPTCSASFAEGTQVTLTATAVADSTFQGWSGGGCSGTATTCAVTLGAADVTVTATFAVVPPPPPPPPAQHTLTVAKAGAGTGTVTSAPTGLDCGATCSASFDEGTQVTLTAAAADGSTFQGFGGGGCSGTDTTCALTLGTADVTVTATFDLVPPAFYTSTELTAPDGQVAATAISPSGDVVGYFVPEKGEPRAFFHDAETGAFTPLPPEDRPAYPAAVNDAGVVLLSDADQQVFLVQGGKLTPVETDGPSVPTGLNAKGLLVGWSTPPGAGQSQLGFVSDGKTTTPFNGLKDAPDSSPALAIDDQDRVVGVSGEHAVRFEGRDPVELPVPTTAVAIGISDTGQIVGRCKQQGKFSQGFVFDLTTGAVTTVDPPKDFLSLSFQYVSTTGIVLGTALEKNGITHVMRWSDGHLEDVQDLLQEDPGFDLEFVHGLASDGRILVSGHAKDGTLHSAVLVPGGT